MRIYKRNPKAKAWTCEVKDHTDTVRKIATGTVDKGSATEIGRRVSRLVEFRRAGLQPDAGLQAWINTQPPKMIRRLSELDILDRGQEQQTRTLHDHLGDYQAHLTAKANTAQHIFETVSKIRRILSECRYRKHGEITRDNFQSWMHEAHTAGLSACTCNSYAVAFNGFLRWMVPTRAATNPVQGFTRYNEEADRRYERRILSTSELGQLIHSAEHGSPWRGCSGRERGLIYRTAAATGYRWGEVRQLTRADFRLDETPPVLRIQAATAKNRKRDGIPMREDFAQAMRDYFGDTPALPTAPAFPNQPKGGVGAKMVRFDLRPTDIAYKTPDGVCDFHSVRGFYVSALIRSGVSPAVVQQLARHCDINLTLKRYTHIALETKAEAVNAMPEIFATETGEAEARKTGTDDADEHPKKVGAILGVSGGESRQIMARCGKENDSINSVNSETKNAGNTVKTSVSRVMEFGAPGRIRTCDLRIRNPMLYPTEPRAPWKGERSIAPQGSSPEFHDEMETVSPVHPKEP